MSRNATDVQMEIYRKGEDPAGRRPVSIDEWESRARAVLDKGPFDYLAGGAGGEETMRANREAFYLWRLRPRVVRDVAERDLSVTLFGRKLSVPFMLAPIGVMSIFHRDAEAGPARAAAAEGVPYILSNAATMPMEEVAAAMGQATRWFQLYPPRDRELTVSFIRRAEAAGYSAIVVTLDSCLLGWRERDLRNSYLPFLKGHGIGNYISDPVFRSKLARPPEQDMEAAALMALDEGNNISFGWKDVDFIRGQTELPLLLKGITHPDDAELAVEHGVDGVIVSNHGGRQLDGAIATLDALPSVCDVVKGRIAVMMDSGIRKGADVLKALALGAAAVMVGRPYAFAYAADGEEGVREVIRNLTAEIELHLAIAGHRRIRDLNRSLVIKALIHT